MAVRFGIIGCGGISRRFCNALHMVEGMAVAAVAARDRDKAEVFGREVKAERVCADYAELAADGSLDVVYIGTTHHNHHELIRLCLEQGRRVVCEKPMVLTEAHARELTELAAEKGLLLMEAMWVRCNPSIRRATRWVREGLIGDVKLVKADFCSNVPYNPTGRIYNPALAGGAIYDVGVYVIEFASGILGENACEVAGTVQYVDTGVDSAVSLSLKYPGGALASLNCGVTAATPHDAAVYGTEGSIVLERFWRTQEARRYDREGALVETFREEFAEGFVYEIRHVADLVEQGAVESDLIPWRDTIACARVFDTILRTK